MNGKTLRLVLLTGAAIVLPFTVLAESSGGGEGNSRLEDFFWFVLPLVVFAFLIYVLLMVYLTRARKSPLAQKQLSYLARNEQHVVRSEQHMERVEALLERLVVALESRDK